MSLEQTVDNLEIRYANAVTFVGTSNTMIDTTTGRIQTKGFQHNSNVITDVSGPHGRGAATLKKYPEIVFDDTSKMDMGEGGTTNGLIFKQAGYTITASSTHSSNGRVPYRAFNGDHTTGWICDSGSWNSGTNVYQGGRGIGGYDGEWIKLELPNKIKVETMYIEADLNSGRRPLTGKLLGSDDDSTWVIIKDLTSIPNQDRNTLNIGSTVAYKYIAFLTETIPSGNDTVWIDEIEYYGYEEDPPAGDHSVDTTFMSRFNNPHTTGVQVLVDGATGVGTNQISGGPDPSGNQSTYVTDGKYWTLNGTLTSNLSVEANTFLEGDQPHAVSVWFNSSNLEANVSNTCVFSIASEEKLDSVNLDLQSNTWHNLTYAYQGEGGSRVTYLDGRKVAEDQAEDTFGEYPPFAMTGFSQGGYVVSASGQPNSVYYPWTAFDKKRGNVGEGWFTVGGLYTIGGDGAATSSATEFPIGTGRRGEYLDLEMPHKLKVSYFVIQTRNVNNSKIPEDSPHEGYLYGSNDGINWTEIKFFSGLTYGGASVNSATEESVAVNSTTAFKYLRLQATKRGGANGSDSYVGISELKYYGHRENDLVRLPDPTNVLKYPHIPLTDYVQSVVAEPKHVVRRGYAATSSGASNPMYDAPHAFNGVTVSGNGSWHSMGFYRKNNEATPSLAERTPTSSLSSWTANGGSTTGELTTHTGEWLKIQLPHKIVLSSIILRQRTGVPLQKVRLFSIVGSNDDTNWFLVHQELTRSGTSTSLQEPDPHTMTGSYASVAFKYFAIVIHAGVTDNIYDHVAIGEWELYGTGVDSIPIQIGGGNIDKVANFRVYDKFIGEDQALEIWDAQKDEFGRAKSSMTLQKGRLGIGTTEPEGRLAVLDEPSGLEEFPPRAMTSSETYIEGHGVFRASSSSEYSATYTAFDAFDKITNNDAGVADNAWLSANSSLYASASDYAFTGSTTLGNGTVAGEWLKLELPYKIVLKSIILSPRPSSTTHLNQAPEDFKIYGSNDDINWIEVLSETGAAPALWTGTNFITDTSTTSYRYFAIVVQKTVGYDGFTAISGLKYFGTREQGQSVLHDGQLTLTKNLDVPRIGPPIDADDTPRRDRLVVEYNTSTNPTFEGVVRDTSGRGLDGVFYRGAYYDAAEKAFEFDGADEYIQTAPLGFTGDQVHSVSLWFWSDVEQSTFGGNEHALWGTGGLSNSTETGLSMYNTYVQVWRASGATRYPMTFNANRWNHLCMAYSSGGSINSRLWLNGVELTQNSSVTSTSAYSFQTGEYLILGTWINNATVDTSYTWDGKISNFKLYDTALTASEVKTLYDMGRCDEGHHVVNFSKTRVGIGLGDGEAPMGDLDVRGPANFFDLEVQGVARLRGSQSYPNRPVAMVGKTNGRVYDPDVIVYNSVLYNDGSLYNSSNGRFTAPEGYAGYYLITYTGLGGLNETAPNTRWQLNGNDLSWGSAHINNSPCSSRWGFSCQLIYYLNVGDYLTHRVISASIYGTATTHSTTVVMFMGSR